MTFANPWGLLALLAVPAILVIHLYQRRFPTLVVAGLHLWSVETRQSQAGRRRERLPVSTSLILECLAALLLAALLSGPRIGEADRVPHLIVVLDDSASMSARSDGHDPRAAAVREITRRVEAASRGAVVSLITTGVRPSMLVGPAASWDDARAALARWSPQSPRHGFESAWDLALQLATPEASVLFLTDLVPESKSLPERLEIVSLGERVENLAIEASRWTFDPQAGRGELFVRVKNFSERVQATDLVGTRDQTELFRKRISVPAGGSESRLFELPGGVGQVTVSLGGRTTSSSESNRPGDGLRLDSEVDLVEPKSRLVTVAVTLPEGMGAGRVKRVLEALPAVQLGGVEEAHLVIGPAGERPGESESRWWLGIGPVSLEAARREVAKDLLGPYLLEKGHPLLEGVVLGGVIWGGAQSGLANVTPLVSSGETPLLARLTGTRTVGYLLNIDLARSNLPEAPDWPILLTNLIELRRAELPGLSRWNYRLGETVRFRLYEGAIDPQAEGTAPLTLTHNGVTRAVPRGPTVELTGTNDPGLYVLREGERELGRFAMQFNDLEESDLRNLKVGAKAAKVAGASELEVESHYSWWLLAGIVVVLGLLLGDYRSLAPRGVGVGVK